jgi:hypothetical protein
LLITQHVDGDIYGIALATHQTYFRGDNMQWLKDNAEAIDWIYCPILHRQVLGYDPFAPIESTNEPNLTVKKDEPPDDIPF